LAAGLIIYLSLGHQAVRYKALASHQPTNAAAQAAYHGPDSVAVLPFANVRGDSATDYLSDGITESLIASLARLPLKVRSRDSVFRYKAKDMDVSAAAAHLGVAALVTGRVLLRGDAVEVSAELTDVRDNTEIWGHRYSGKTSDIVSIQQQMAGDIAAHLRSSLSPFDQGRVTNPGTQDSQAYSLYLKGRYAWNKRTKPDLEAAISFFNQAIARDPTYALAYSGLADAYSVLHFYAGNPSEYFPKSNAAARRALELDPTLAHPHAVLGDNEMSYDWDFAGGEAEYKQAIALDPNDATAHQWYAESLSAIGGREQDALAEINRAYELDPLSPIITRVVAGVQVTAGHIDKGIAICTQLAQQNPTFAVAHDCLFYAYWAKRMYPQLLEQSKAYALLTGNPEDAENSDALSRGYLSAGWPGALTQLIAVFQNRRKTGYASPFIIARLYADLGDRDKAFAWLDTAYREHDCLLIELRTWPQFDSLRSDPRYAQMVNRIGLPPLSR
jgi:TolB-like protein/tetratricopeptide (TPR) repeat protein